MPDTIHSVSGTIYDKFDAPLAKVTVEAFDKDLRKEQSIGKTTTDPKGFYSIIYNPENFPQADNKPPSPHVLT